MSDFIIYSNYLISKINKNNSINCEITYFVKFTLEEDLDPIKDYIESLLGLSIGRVRAGSGQKLSCKRVENAKPPQPPPTAAVIGWLGFGLAGLRADSGGVAGLGFQIEKKGMKAESTQIQEN